MALALQIVRFGEVLEEMLEELLPNRITEYAYELANLFNTFYTECKARCAPMTTRPLCTWHACEILRDLGISCVHGQQAPAQAAVGAACLTRMHVRRVGLRPGGGQRSGGVTPAAVRSNCGYHAAVLCPAGHQAPLPHLTHGALLSAGIVSAQ